MAENLGRSCRAYRYIAGNSSSTASDLTRENLMRQEERRSEGSTWASALLPVNLSLRG
jgi:hypothetical protein